jgi:hypothetical protein
LDKEYDLWVLADQQLRNDHDEREIMEKYDRILEQSLGSELKPAVHPREAKTTPQIPRLEDQPVKRCC